MKKYKEELEEVKLLLRNIVRQYEFFANKESNTNGKSTSELIGALPHKLMLEFLEHDIELARKFGNSRGKRSNGGKECDVDDGPCDCGAWHIPETISPEQLIDPEAEVLRLRGLLYGK